MRVRDLKLLALREFQKSGLYPNPSLLRIIDEIVHEAKMLDHLAPKYVRDRIREVIRHLRGAHRRT